MHEFAVIIFGDWEIVDRMGTKSRTCSNAYALCDPSNTLTTTVRFICVSFRGGNPEERVAGVTDSSYEDFLLSKFCSFV